MFIVWVPSLIRTNPLKPVGLLSLGLIGDIVLAQGGPAEGGVVGVGQGEMGKEDPRLLRAV